MYSNKTPESGTKFQKKRNKTSGKRNKAQDRGEGGWQRACTPTLCNAPVSLRTEYDSTQNSS